MAQKGGRTGICNELEFSSSGFYTFASKNKMNWSKWSFKLLVYVFVINLSIAFITVYYPNFSGESSSSVFVRNILILTLAQWILIFGGIGLSILSIKHKEKRGFKFYLALIGHPTFVILNLLSAVYG